MRIFLVLFLLMSSIAFGQPLILTIDSITSKEGDEKKRIFTVKYNLTNTTKDTLSFFFYPKDVSPSTGGSLTKEMYYKIYENNTFIEIGSAFNQLTRQKIDFNFNSEMSQTHKDSVMIVFMAEKLEVDPARLLKIYKEEGALGLMDPSNDYIKKSFAKKRDYYHILRPNQTEHFEANFSWNKSRYYYNEPNEFYLDENAKHYFELTLVALKEEFKDKVDADLFDKIMKQPNFIKGVFVSNKVEINLQN